MPIRYLGSKARIVDAIVDLVGSPSSTRRVFCDAFCGTGAVAEAATECGWKVLVNDNLNFAVIGSRARLLGMDDVPFANFGGYSAAVRRLVSASPREGFLYRSYSPASKRYGCVERKYFTETNAAHIDGMRMQIDAWEGLLSDDEKALLLADLLEAANRVSNTAGTYGYFLKTWNVNALDEITIEPRKLRNGKSNSTWQCEDVFDLDTQQVDVLYLDPPYTKRQYAAYYHVLETIALYDEPRISGKSGLREWESKASPFCYKSKAQKALFDLIINSRAHEVFLSYSDDGHADLDELSESLSSYGDTVLYDIKEIGRYSSNGFVDDQKTVKERLMRFTLR